MGLLEGKVALVTGAGHGIGRGIALRFSCEGARVGVLDCDSKACEEVTRHITDSGGQATALPCDVSETQAVGDAVRELLRLFGSPTILVHNAAVMPVGTIEQTSEEDWERVYRINVKGAYLTSKQIVPLMRQAGGGSIILMSSITGVNGFPGLVAYSGTKGALIAFARALAIDHAGDSIRVNSVSPGTIDSPMLHEFVASQSDPVATRKAFDQIQPRGRVGTVDEVVNVVTFLASDQSSLISGANICADGAASVKGEQPRL